MEFCVSELSWPIHFTHYLLGKVPSKENKISFLLEKIQKLYLLHMDCVLKLQYVPNLFSPADIQKQ